MSNIGAVVWSFSAAICLFSYTLLRTRQESRDVAGFLLFGGCISLVLLLDDLFMLHEQFYPRYFGVGEKIVFSFYAALNLFYLAKFRTLIIESDFVLLLLALFFFALSMLLDLLPETSHPWYDLFEDGLKLFGIVSWFAYQFSVCLQEVQSALQRNPEENPMGGIAP